MADYSIDVSVDVRDNELDAAERKIKGMDGKRIKVDFDVGNQLEKNLKNINDLQKKTQKAQLDGNANLAKEYDKQWAAAYSKNQSLYASGAYKDFKANNADVLEGIKEASKYQRDINEASIADARAKKQSAANQKYLNDLQSTYAKEVTSSYQKQQGYIKDIGKLQSSMIGLDPTRNAEQLNTYKKQLSAVQSSLANEASKGYNYNFTSDMKSSLQSTAIKLNNDVALKNAKATDAMMSQYANVFSAYKSGSADNDLNNLKRRIGYTEDWAKANPSLAKSFDNVNSSYQKLNETWDKSDIQDRIKNYNDFGRSIAQFTKDQNDYASSIRGVKNLDADLELDRLFKKEQIAEIIDRNKRAEKHDPERYSDLKGLIGSVESATNMADLSRFNTQARLLEKQMSNAGTGGKTFFQQMGEKMGTLGQYVIGAFGFDTAIRAVSSMYENTNQIDKAMTELRKVTDENESTYSAYLSRAGQGAKDVGTSISNFVNSTADFARLGYNMKDAELLAKNASIYSVVGDMSIGNATESLISTMKAFKVEAKDSIGVVDKFNKVGNEFAISSEGIGQALFRSASSLSSSNNTLDESIGLITAANSVVQDPAMVGTFLKTNNCFVV